MVYIPHRERADWSGQIQDEMAVFPKGKHDDLTDSAVQAIKHLRDNGMLRSDEETRAQEVDEIKRDMAKAKRKPRYPGMRATA